MLRRWFKQEEEEEEEGLWVDRKGVVASSSCSLASLILLKPKRDSPKYILSKIYEKCVHSN